MNVLLIFDDVIADLKSESTNKKLISLIFNRRHKFYNGMLSIMVTSQKYKTIPTAIRVVINFMVLFKLQPSEIKAISDELVYSNMDFEGIVSSVLTNDNTFILYNISSGRIYKEFEEINITNGKN